MRRLHLYFLVIALLVSLFIHLFLLNAAYVVTLKLGLFENRAADDLFRIRTIERPTPSMNQRPTLRDEDTISFERPDEHGLSNKEEMEDRRAMLAQRGLISFDASEAEINEALKRLFEGETVEPAEAVQPDDSAASTIAQEILAIEEGAVRERIDVPTRTIDRNAQRGWATSDIYIPDEEASAGEVLEALANAEGRTNRDTDTTEDGSLGPLAESLIEEGGLIPTIIKPPGEAGPIDIESAVLEDVVAESAAALRKYPPLDDLLSVTMRTYHARGEAEGYFMIVIEPRRDRHTFTIIPKDIIFVVDTSSSIQQPKLDRYVEGLQQCIEKLNPHDRFDIVEFKTQPNRMADHLVPVSKERIRTASFFLNELRSSGNTDVYSAVQSLVSTRPDPNRPYVIFLVTDGRANRGVVENRNIINRVAAINRNQAAIYSFAGGTKFNEYLLDLLSYRNKGESRFEQRTRSIPDSLTAFHEEIRDPILLNLQYQIGTVSEAEVYPKVLPDFFLQSRITICGRYRDEHEFSMQILGTVGGHTKEFIFKQSFDQPDNGDARVARQWAFHKIYALIGRMVEHGEDAATLAEIRALGKRYGIQTPYYE